MLSLFLNVLKINKKESQQPSFLAITLIRTHHYLDPRTLVEKPPYINVFSHNMTHGDLFYLFYLLQN